MRCLTRLLCVLLPGTFAAIATNVLANESEQTTVYYYRFTAPAPAVPLTESSLRNDRPKVVLRGDSEYNILYVLLKSKGGNGHLDKNNLRLLVPAQNGKPEYLVDAEGVVRTGKKEYALKPSAFLRLGWLLPLEPR